MLKDKIMSEEIKIFKIDNMYRIYGKTFEDREELKNIGAVFNSDLKKLELSEENFRKLDDEIQLKVIRVQEKHRQMDIERVAQLILSGNVTIYEKDDSYKLFVQGFYKELKNIGFSLENNTNYSISKTDFERTFSNEVKEFVNEYQESNDYNVQAQNIVEEPTEEEFEM